METFKADKNQFQQKYKKNVQVPQRQRVSLYSYRFLPHHDKPTLSNEINQYTEANSLDEVWLQPSYSRFLFDFYLCSIEAQLKLPLDLCLIFALFLVIFQIIE